MVHTLSLVLAALGIVFAAFVKGVTGLGFPVIGIPIAAQFLDPQTAVIAIQLPAFAMNVVQAFQGDLSPTLARRFIPTMASLVPGALIGTALLAKVPGALITGMLGLVVTVYAALSLWRLRLLIKPAQERRVGVLVGFFGGIIGGATGIFSPPLVIYLTALQLPKATFVSAVSICFIAGQLPQFVGFIGFRLLTVPRLGMAALFGCLSVAGFLAGMRLQRSISQQLFAKGVLVILLVVGLNLLRAGILGFWYNS
jgi:uncharacterized membrane protein YfcA